MSSETVARTPPFQLVCSEVWGGNRPIHSPVELPGLRGVLYSQPCDGGRGGDVHYLSVCGSGLQSRACLADVAGHGETVAAIGAEMHAHLRRCMNEPDQRKVLNRLNVRLSALGIQAMTTAASITYYPPNQSLSVSYAGHPPGWFLSREAGSWSRLALDDVAPKVSDFTNLPLAIEPTTKYTRRTFNVEIGDRLLLVTDGVLELPGKGYASAGGGMDFFGEEGVEEFLNTRAEKSCEEIANGLLDAMAKHAGNPELTHDDVSFIVLEIIPGPSEPAFWLAIRNRVTRPRGNAPGAAFESHSISRKE